MFYINKVIRWIDDWEQTSLGNLIDTIHKHCTYVNMYVQYVWESVSVTMTHIVHMHMHLPLAHMVKKYKHTHAHTHVKLSAYLSMLFYGYEMNECRECLA